MREGEEKRKTEYSGVFACVCVCVYVREREKMKWKNWRGGHNGKQTNLDMFPPPFLVHHRQTDLHKGPQGFWLTGLQTALCCCFHFKWAGVGQWGEESAWTQTLPLANSNPCSLIEIYTNSVLYGVLKRGKRKREEEKESWGGGGTFTRKWFVVMMTPCVSLVPVHCCGTKNAPQQCWVVVLRWGERGIFAFI